jgi:heterodisulfide reductase subunit A-like polyferredoxin
MYNFINGNGISYICLNKQLKNMKKLIAVASFAAVLLASCTPKASTATLL